MHAKSIKFAFNLAVVLAVALLSMAPSHAAEAEIAKGNAGRSVQDITAAMSYYKPDPELARSARAKIGATPPATDSKRDLANFYRERGQAAASLGLIEQQIADLREAYKQGKGLDLYASIIGDLAAAEANGGNVLISAELRREQIELAGNFPAKSLVPYTVLARQYALSGDIKAASNALNESESAYEKAKSNPRSPWAKNQHLWRYQIELSRAQILLAQGKAKEAEQATRLALDAWHADSEPFKNRIEQGGGQAENVRELLGESIEQVLANAMLQQGRVVEAEITSRAILSKILKRTGRYSPGTGKALTTLAGIISAQGRYREAAILAQEALESLSKAGVPPHSSYYGNATKRYAEVLALDGKWAETLKQYETLAKTLAAMPETPSGFSKGDLIWGMSLAKMGQAAKAMPMLERELKGKAATFGEDHYEAAEARAAFAMALAGTGDIARAGSEYGRAIPELLNRDANDADEEGGGAKKARRRAILLSSYIDFLHKAASQNPAKATELAAEAFRIADVIRGQSVQKALAASAARAAANTPSLAELVRKEQDLGREIAAQFFLLSDVLALPPAQQDAKAVANLRASIDALRAERTPLKKEIATRFPEYAELVSPAPLLASSVSKLLQGKEALVSFLVSDESEYVWAVHKDGRIAFSRLGMKRSELADAVGRLRKALDAEATAVEEIPQFDSDLAYRVFAATLKPVESIWQDADTLLIVPDGALSQLPVALLTTQPGKPGKDLNKVSFTGYRALPWLVRKVAVVQLPTVSALKTLRAMPVAKPGRLAFAGFGDPYFSKAQQVEGAREHKESPAPVSAGAGGTTTLTKREAVDVEELAQLPRLPDTREEVNAIAQALGANLAQDVFIGAAANEATVKRMDLSNRRVIAFATHGLVPGELRGLSQPALALSSPAVVGGDGDGLLTVEEILGLKLDADWVVLSACNTASADGAGGEALSGLGRAFFYAGTRAMLVTHWPVESSAARLLTTGLFKRYAQNNGTSRAQALRASILDMIDNAQFKAPGAKQPAFVYAHPIFWAPFVLVGDGGV
ncbi:MAG: CHAT domain-containing protein [Burkholderiales bacterium]|nr:CHAT domain-containing protein [Burkholderiales bacterium]